MDGERFDALTRALALRPSRRGVVRAIVAGSLGGLLTRLSSPARSAADGGGRCVDAGWSCDRDGMCCSGRCEDGLCVEGECRVDTDCPGADVCRRAVCIPADCGPTHGCGPNQVCCDGFCRMGSCCSDDCLGDPDCVADADGIFACEVVDCGPDQVPCDPSQFCCDGLCRQGACCTDDDCRGATTCQEFSEGDFNCQAVVCGADGDCSPDQSCCGGVCQTGGCCGTDADCGAGLLCCNGACFECCGNADCGENSDCTVAICSGFSRRCFNVPVTDACIECRSDDDCDGVCCHGRCCAAGSTCGGQSAGIGYCCITCDLGSCCEVIEVEEGSFRLNAVNCSDVTEYPDQSSFCCDGGGGASYQPDPETGEPVPTCALGPRFFP